VVEDPSPVLRTVGATRDWDWDCVVSMEGLRIGFSEGVSTVLEVYTSTPL